MSLPKKDILRNIIRELIKKEIDEANSTASGGGEYQTPHSFKGSNRKGKKNKKAGFCRNFAMRISKSEYVAFLDSDDIWDKEKLSKQLSFMIKNKHSFTYTNYSTFKSTNENASKIINPPFQFSFDDFIKNSFATNFVIRIYIYESDGINLQKSLFSGKYCF